MADEPIQSPLAGPAADAAPPPSTTTTGAEPPPVGTAPLAPPVAPKRPEWLGKQHDQFWDDKAGLKAKEWNDYVGGLEALKAEHDIRLTGVPPSPDKYELKLPPEVKMPDGKPVMLDAKEPLLAKFREVAHAEKMPQEQFSKLLGAYVQTEVDKKVSFDEAISKQRAELGGPEQTQHRLRALQTALAGRFSEADAKDFINGVFTAKQVKMLESLVRGNAYAPQVPGSNPPADPTKPPADFDSWSTDRKFAWGREHQKDLEPLQPGYRKRA